MICCSEPGSGCHVRAIPRSSLSPPAAGRTDTQEEDTRAATISGELQLAGHVTFRLHGNSSSLTMAAETFYLRGEPATSERMITKHMHYPHHYLYIGRHTAGKLCYVHTS